MLDLVVHLDLGLTDLINRRVIYINEELDRKNEVCISNSFFSKEDVDENTGRFIGEKYEKILGIITVKTYSYYRYLEALERCWVTFGFYVGDEFYHDYTIKQTIDSIRKYQLIPEDKINILEEKYNLAMNNINKQKEILKKLQKEFRR